MQATLKSKVSEIFTKYNFSREDAGFITDVLNEIDNRQDGKFQLSKELFLTQKDKVEIIGKIEAVRIDVETVKSTVYKTAYTVGLIQFLAILGSLLATLNFMHK